MPSLVERGNVVVNTFHRQGYDGVLLLKDEEMRLSKVAFAELLDVQEQAIPIGAQFAEIVNSMMRLDRV